MLVSIERLKLLAVRQIFATSWECSAITLRRWTKPSNLPTLREAERVWGQGEIAALIGVERTKPQSLASFSATLTQSWPNPTRKPLPPNHRPCPGSATR